MIAYEDLERHFKLPKTWMPGRQAYFDRLKKIPRKLKKSAKEAAPFDRLSLEQKLWYLQGLRNPDLNRFLIKKIAEA